MKTRMVWVELQCGSLRPLMTVHFTDAPYSSLDGGVSVVRIFKSKKAAFASGRFIAQTLHKDAVSSIRHAVWLRCKGECEICMSMVTEDSGHMHEKKHRGKGGEVSIENSIFICPCCHRREHILRSPRWKKPLTTEQASGNMESPWPVK